MNGTHGSFLTVKIMGIDETWLGRGVRGVNAPNIFLHKNRFFLAAEDKTGT
jgi:hypothetical protein